MVSSVKDPRVAAARSLQTRAQRTAAGRCLAEGRSLIGQLLESGHELQVALRSDAAAEAADDSLAAALRAAGVAVHPVRAAVLRQVS